MMTDTYPVTRGPVTTGLFAVKHDGKPIVGPLDENGAFAFLLHHQGQSVSYALTYGGYTIEEIQPWSDDEAKRYANQARGLFNHGHAGYWDEMTRDNCGACALEGWRESDEEGDLAPNYGGWARAYVEAQRWIPDRWRAAYESDQLHGDNPAYSVALARSVAYFGVRFGA